MKKQVLNPLDVSSWLLSGLVAATIVGSSSLTAQAQTSRPCPSQHTGSSNVNPQNPKPEDEAIEQPTVSGTVAYRQRIALPPNAKLVVRLEDTGRADAPATVIAETTIETNGQQVPIPFTLTYDPAQISPRGRYTVRAQIFYGDQLRWTSTRLYSVALQEAQSAEVDLQLELVGSSNR